MEKNKKSKFTELTLHCSNIKETYNFYKKFLNCKVNEYYSNEGYLLLETENILFSIEGGGYKKTKLKNLKENPFFLRFYLDTLDELKEASKNLKKNNIDIIEDITKEEWGYILTFMDPDGNKLEYIVRKDNFSLFPNTQ